MATLTESVQSVYNVLKDIKTALVGKGFAVAGVPPNHWPYVIAGKGELTAEQQTAINTALLNDSSGHYALGDYLNNNNLFVENLSVTNMTGASVERQLNQAQNKKSTSARANTDKYMLSDMKSLTLKNCSIYSGYQFGFDKDKCPNLESLYVENCDDVPKGPFTDIYVKDYANTNVTGEKTYFGFDYNLSSGSNNDGVKNFTFTGTVSGQELEELHLFGYSTEIESVKIESEVKCECNLWLDENVARIEVPSSIAEGSEIDMGQGSVVVTTNNYTNPNPDYFYAPRHGSVTIPDAARKIEMSSRDGGASISFPSQEFEKVLTVYDTTLLSNVSKETAEAYVHSIPIEEWTNRNIPGWKLNVKGNGGYRSSEWHVSISYFYFFYLKILPDDVGGEGKFKLNVVKEQWREKNMQPNITKRTEIREVQYQVERSSSGPTRTLLFVEEVDLGFVTDYYMNHALMPMVRASKGTNREIKHVWDKEVKFVETEGGGGHHEFHIVLEIWNYTMEYDVVKVNYSYTIDKYGVLSVW